ncbi:MAG: HPr family phosphocarrier protein [Alphaproteobacteria bacterium]|nr:HPr family phosphocarrier protein [Alphaproteobacteria bacterium]
MTDNAGELCNIAVIGNQRGLHARAAAKFVKIAEGFAADITIMKDDMRVSARSIMGLMMLAAVQGAQIKICGAGPDAPAAIDALTDFVKRKFDEE